MDEIEKRLSFFEKIRNFDFFLSLFCIVLSLDCYLVIMKKESLLTFQIGTFISLNNFMFILGFVFSYGFFTTVLIPMVEFILFKLIYKVPFVFTFEKRQQKKSGDFKAVFELQKIAIEEKNEFIQKIIASFYENKKHYRKISQLSLTALFLILLNYFYGQVNSVHTLTLYVFNAVFIHRTHFIIACCLIGFILLLFYSIKLGYDAFWDDMVYFPKSKDEIHHKPI